MGNNNKNNSDFRVGEETVAVHSQVRKIKKELEEIIDWSVPEMKPVLIRESSSNSRHRLSPSPLGLGAGATASGRPISVGH